MSVASGTYCEASGTDSRPVKQTRTLSVTCNYLRPSDEKQMVVLFQEEDFDAWRNAPPEQSMKFMRACAPKDLVAIGEPRP